MTAVATSNPMASREISDKFHDKSWDSWLIPRNNYFEFVSFQFMVLASKCVHPFVLGPDFIMLLCSNKFLVYL